MPKICIFGKWRLLCASAFTFVSVSALAFVQTAQGADRTVADASLPGRSAMSQGSAVSPGSSAMAQIGAFPKITPLLNEVEVKAFPSFSNRQGRPRPPVVCRAPVYEIQNVRVLGFLVDMKTGNVNVFDAKRGIVAAQHFVLRDRDLQRLRAMLESEKNRHRYADGSIASHALSPVKLLFAVSGADWLGQCRRRLYHMDVPWLVLPVSGLLQRAAKEAGAAAPWESVAESVLPPQQAFVFPKIAPFWRVKEMRALGSRAQRNGWQPLPAGSVRIVPFNGFSNRPWSVFEVNLNTGEVSIADGDAAARLPQAPQAFRLSEAELAKLQKMLESEDYRDLPSENMSVGLDGNSLLIESDWNGEYLWRLHWSDIPVAMADIVLLVGNAYEREVLALSQTDNLNQADNR